jgi:D-psicose/D-tagatose/L-ribulose 3-epimerase
MRIGMHLCLFTAQPTAAEHGPILSRLKQWGYDGVEMHVAMTTRADLHELSRQAADLGLGCVANLVMPASAADPASSDPTLRQAALDMIRQAIEKAAILKSELIVGPMFQGLGRFSGLPPTEQEWNWAADVIRQGAKEAAAANIRLALEPLNRFEMYMVNTVADGARFCDLVGASNVGLLVDTHHGNIEENDVPAAWTAVADRIFHVHISENHRGIPGTGHAARPEIFAALRDMGYDGWINIETPSHKIPRLVPRLHLWRGLFEREEPVAVEGLRYIRRQWAEVKDAKQE